MVSSNSETVGRFFHVSGLISGRLSGAEAMQLLGRALDAGWRRAQVEDLELQGWMSYRSACQRRCMVSVISVSLKTLWAVGELTSKSGRSAFAKALGDAVRACYPSFRALNIDHVVQKALQSLSAVALGLQGGHLCPEPWKCGEKICLRWVRR